MKKRIGSPAEEATMKKGQRLSSGGKREFSPLPEDRNVLPDGRKGLPDSRVTILSNLSGKTVPNPFFRTR